MWVQSLGWEHSLGEGMVTHSSILAWRIPWTEGPGGLQAIGSQRVRQDLGTNIYLPKDTICISWLINRVNLDNESTLSFHHQTLLEYLISGVPPAHEASITSSKETKAAAHRDTGNFPRATESHGSIPHTCKSQIQACVILPCCSQRYRIVLCLRTTYFKTE